MSATVTSWRYHGPYEGRGNAYTLTVIASEPAEMDSFQAVTGHCVTCRWAVDRAHDGEDLPLLCTRLDVEGAGLETNDGSYPSVHPDFGCVQREGKA